MNCLSNIIFFSASKEKLEVVEGEHRAQLASVQQKLTEAESKLSRLQQEKQQQSQQSIVRSRSPPDLALQRATEERRPGEVGVMILLSECLCLFKINYWLILPYSSVQGMDQSELAETDSAPRVSALWKMCCSVCHFLT